MAVARDTGTYDSLKRTPSYAGSYSVSLKGNSTLSIEEDVGTVDIDAIVNRRWVLDEVIGQLQSRLAILSGGRDRRGGPIITVYATEHADLRPLNMGKILSYLSKVPDESVQGLGFTIILDAQNVSWRITKHAIASLQLTFVEHIHQLLIVKPRAFWQRQKTGVNVTLNKSRYGFPVIMLESSIELFQHLQVSQLTSDLKGSIKFNHQQWIDTQRVLEKHLIELLNRLDAFEHVREQLEMQERPSSLIESRDSVRRHVDAQDIISKVNVDCECEAVSHSIARLRPCSNPDFIACFARLDEMCSCLQSMQVQLQRMWDGKGAKLDQIVQLRKYEYDSNQMLQWIVDTTASLSRDHTHIGDSLSSAELKRKAFSDFQARIASQYQEISRVISVGERLVAARHYALDVMQVGNRELRSRWEKFSAIMEDRNNMFELSVVFHDWKQKLFQHIDVWSEACSSSLTPSSTDQARELLAQHRLIQERYQQMYNTTRTEGHKLIEKLRKPVGESSVPAQFVAGTRHVKEILESLFDEYNWLSEQWSRRNIALQKAVTNNQYLDETRKVHSWLSERGWMFLTRSRSIGGDASGAQSLIQQHDAFEIEAKEVYSSSLQLFEKARQLNVSGECDREMVEAESRGLEAAIHTFAASLDERRDMLVQACTFYCNVEMLTSELTTLAQPVSQSQFSGLPSTLEKRQQDYKSRHTKVDHLAKQVFGHADSLIGQLEVATKGTSEVGHPVDYAPTVRSVQQVLGEVRGEKWRVDESCARRQTRWTLTLQLDRLQRETEKYLTAVESWCNQARGREPDPAVSTLESQLQLDAMQKRYNQFTATHNEIIVRGKSISMETDQLDSIMFGSTRGAVHPTTTAIGQLETRMLAAKKVLDEVAVSQLRRCQECLDYHLLQHRSHTLSSALQNLTTSTAQLPPIGHSLPSAESALQKHTENSQRMEALSGDVDRFCREVEESVGSQHYEAAHLGLLARSLLEKNSRANRTVTERLRVARGGVGFYKGVDKLASIMDKCRGHFSSSDTVQSVVDAARLLATLHELKELVEQAMEGVRSQGKQLVEVLATITTASSSSDVSPRKGSRELQSGGLASPLRDSRSFSMCVEDSGMSDLDRCKRRPLRHSTDDLLDAVAGEGSEVNGEMEWDSPRLLVSPRKTRPGLKSYKSSTTSLALTPDQIMIESQLYKVDQKLAKLMKLWDHRRTQLETARRVIEFMEQVPQLQSWLKTRGEELLQNKHNYGRSKEEVLQLLSEHEEREEGEVAKVKEQVEALMASYQQVESSGHRELNQIRGVATSLEWKWVRFYSDIELRRKNLHLSLLFQENLFEGSNWVQKSKDFLETLRQRTELVDTSEEAASLRDELTLYFSYTLQEQEDRVKEGKAMSAELHSNLLMELAGQTEQSTADTRRDLHTCQNDLEKLHEKLVQIESEKDKERRLIKQRERVLDEFLKTEEAYVADLKLVEKCRPRFVAVLPSTLKGREDTIFSNIHEIEDFHRLHFLPQLRERATDMTEVASIFVECADKMTEIYVPYCNNKAASEELLASHRTYLSRMQSMFGLDNPLSSLLIKPVQRITKYPLLLKDSIKYTSQLGQDTDILEDALEAVEKILDETNNAIHLSHLRNFEESGAGKLFFQGTLQVSEPKFAIKAEKERQVFVFEVAIVLARKVSLEQAKFIYEYKSKIAVSAVQQLTEFVDGEPLKFTITTADHKLYLKTSSIHVKQVAVRAIRLAILSQNQALMSNSPVMGSRRKFPFLSMDRVTSDLMNPSPRPSPPIHRRAGGSVPTTGSPSINGFDRYQLTSDYTSEGENPLTLKKGEVVEVLDNKIEEKWFVRTLASSPEAGWVPSTVLELMGRDETDQAPKTTITSGPLHPSGNERLQRFKEQTSFGSHDLQSQQVISTLKKITLQEGGEEGEEEDEEEGEGTSLDKPRDLAADSPRFPRTPPQSKLRRSMEGSVSAPSVNVDPSMLLSPGPSTANGAPDTSVDPTLLSSSMPRSTTWNHRHTRRALYRKKLKDRPRSVSSDRSESPPDKMVSGSSEESIPAPDPDSAEKTELDPEKVKKAQEKIKHIIAEVVHTETEYVAKLDMCINGYMKAMQGEGIPDVLEGKERLIFGNIQAVHDFHSNHFLVSLQQAGDDVEAVAKCFLDHAPSFEVYITYCENKPKSESFIWTYLHTGGTFFEEVQKQLKQRQGIDSFLIKPVQRISQYQLLLRDLHKSAQKAGLTSMPQLDAALQQMQDVPKRANDAMTLSMICGYEGAISASGQLIMHDEFTVYEKSRWTGANRHLFLMDQRLILTKEKDADGLYVYKDSLKVHSLSIVEKQDDNPTKFAVGTGPINSWDQYYVLEASSAEKKQMWVDAIKNILKQQFELLKALKQPATNARQRSQTLGPSTAVNSVGMINLSDDSEDEGAEEEDQLTPFTPFSPKWDGGNMAGQRRQTIATTLTVGESTANTFTFKPRPMDLYVVGEDCAPPKDNEGILYIRKGQVYDVMDKSSDWWFARLVRDTTADGVVGRQGWVSGSFLAHFTGELSPEEEASLMAATGQPEAKKSSTLPSNHSPSHSRSHNHSHGSPAMKQQQAKSIKGKNKTKITSSFMEDKSEEEEQQLQRETMRHGSVMLKAPAIISHLTDETVIVSRTLRFRCKITNSQPDLTMEWSHDNRVLTHERAFTSLGDENCLLRLQNVTQEDEGLYTCTVYNKYGSCTSTARLTVIGPPGPPGQPTVKPVTSTSVRISWNLPNHTGHSPITLYLIECKDTLSGRWSTLMQRITEPSAVMDDLMPGTEYVFRIIASNQIGSGPSSPESHPVQTARSMVGSEFSLEPFHEHYKLLNVFARGQFSEVWECLHCSTQQSYVAKLIPLESSQHAHHELNMLNRLSHPNMVSVSATFQTDKNYIFLFQMLKGMNLFEHATITDYLSEHKAAYFMDQLLSALEYLHNLNIVHLAIKPENVMVVRREAEEPVLKLLHLSRAQEVLPGTAVTVEPQLSNMEFEAPETLKGEPITPATDMWSLGVLLYIFLGGTSPFMVDSLDLTKDNICSVRYSFPAKNFKAVSESAKDLLLGLLNGEPSARLTVGQCLQHTWLRSHSNVAGSPTGTASLDLSHLKCYVRTKKWQTSFIVSTSEQ